MTSIVRLKSLNLQKLPLKVKKEKKKAINLPHK